MSESNENPYNLNDNEDNNNNSDSNQNEIDNNNIQTIIEVNNSRKSPIPMKPCIVHRHSTEVDNVSHRSSLDGLNNTTTNLSNTLTTTNIDTTSIDVNNINNVNINNSSTAKLVPVLKNSRSNSRSSFHLKYSINNSYVDISDRVKGDHNPIGIHRPSSSGPLSSRRRHSPPLHRRSSDAACYYKEYLNKRVPSESQSDDENEKSVNVYKNRNNANIAVTSGCSGSQVMRKHRRSKLKHNVVLNGGSKSDGAIRSSSLRKRHFEQRTTSITTFSNPPSIPDTSSHNKAGNKDNVTTSQLLNKCAGNGIRSSSGFETVASAKNSYSFVCLIVLGTRFTVNVQQLRSKPNTMLGRMFSCPMAPSPSASSYYIADRFERTNTPSLLNDASRTSSTNSSHSSSNNGMNKRGAFPFKNNSLREQIISVNNQTRNQEVIGNCAEDDDDEEEGEEVPRRTSSIIDCLNSSIPEIPLNVEGLTPEIFTALLQYYTNGKMHCPGSVSVQEFKAFCDYFLIPFNHITIVCNNLRAFLHEVSNDGAMRMFEKFLEDELLPVMVNSAQMGEREFHVVILMEDDQVEWDPNNPPPMPENEINSQLLYNTQMYRFLKYVENREVAKQVLTEKGLKKIRIGIEGYPTYMEKVKVRPGHRRDVIYNFAQRPFLRLSWEEEEARSRHVDFQFVRSKSNTDLTSLGEVAEHRSVDLPNGLTPPLPSDLQNDDIATDENQINIFHPFNQQLSDS